MSPIATTTPTLLDVAHALAHGIEQEHQGLNAGVLPWKSPCIVISRAEHEQDPDSYRPRYCTTVTLVGDSAICSVQALDGVFGRCVVSLTDPEAITKITKASLDLLARLSVSVGGAT